jgi:hypothetical protein
MNGIALLLIAATLGVEYDWHTTDDGQIEYVLIVEPDFLTSLADGSEIRSSVPPELESVHRLCIRIAQPAKGGVLPRPTAPRKVTPESFRSTRIGLRAADPVTLLWKAVAPQPEEIQTVKYGWQPNKDGLLEYYVQLDPKFLRTLQPGDEIFTQLSTESGRVDTFVVFSNTKPLPKVPGRPATPPLASAPTTPSIAPPTFTPPADPAPPATFGPPASSTAGPPPVSPPRTLGVTDEPALDPNNSHVNPATGYEPAPAPYSPPATGLSPPGSTRPNRNPPDALAGNGLRNPPASAPPLAGGDSFRRDLNPPVNSSQNDLFPAGAYQNQPMAPAPAVPNMASNPPPPNPTYRPSVGYPQDNFNPAPNLNPPNLNPPQPAYNDPRMQLPMAVDYRVASNDNQLASIPNNNSLRPAVRDEVRVNPTSAAPAPPAEKPWWTLVFTAFGLFISIGANLYLGWTAAEFYSRYRLAVERLRTSGR